MLGAGRNGTSDLERRGEAEPGATPNGMVWVRGGTFRMSSDDWDPEERPVHTVRVDGSWMDEQQVTVAGFRRFVEATGYVTIAERPLDPSLYADADPAAHVPEDDGLRRVARARRLPPRRSS